MRKHLLIIVGSLGYGGAEKHVVSLVNGLSVDRFRISLFCITKNAPLVEQLDQVHVEKLMFGGSSRKLDFGVIKKITEYIDNSCVDVVVSTNQYPMVYAVLARAMATRNPYLIDVFHTTIISAWKERLMMILYRPLFFIQNCVVYVCENQRVYWRARHLLTRRTVVIHNGVDVGEFTDTWDAAEKRDIRAALCISPDAYVVGVCAALRPEKCHVGVVRAIAGLRAQGVDAALLVIGDGEERTRIEKTAMELGLQSVVVITGYQSDVRPYIAVCDVMVIFSNAVETFSISALESMAMGKPMVMTRIGGAAEQVVNGYNGFLVEPGDVDSLADCLLRIQDTSVRERMGRNARGFVVERYSIEKMIESFGSLFEGKSGS